MKDGDVLPTTASTPGSSYKREASNLNFFGRGRYKFWALAAILLLAFWSMFTGTVTLRWSVGNLNRFSDYLDSPTHDDLDVLEMEERENVVKHMWSVYTNGLPSKLPRFWHEAFEAAYQDLSSDVPGVREAAVVEIAKMSVRSIDLDPPHLHSTGYQSALRLGSKVGEAGKGWHEVEVIKNGGRRDVNFHLQKK